MEIILKNGAKISCDLEEGLKIVGLINGKSGFKSGKRERLAKEIDGKKVRFCRICGEVLGFHKINLCGKPSCMREAMKQRCHRYLLKRKRNQGLPLGNTNARKIPVLIS